MVSCEFGVGGGEGQGKGGTYAEVAEALKNAFIMWKSSKCICWMMTVGE
jgi:hypothetical protein